MISRRTAVAIVEDNPELREGLTQLIQGTPDYECVGAFDSGDEFLGSLSDIEPEVVLMDIGLPGMSGIECVQRLKAAHPDVEVLMLTVFEDEKKIFDSLCAGASGYLLKKTPPAMILQGLREIRDGGSPMTAKVARKVLASFRSITPGKVTDFQLSGREQEVLSALVNGLSYKMIADQCSISLDTVRSHIRHIYEKLHVNSKGQAINIAMKNRLK